MKYLFLLMMLLFSTVTYGQKYSGSFEAGVTNGNFETDAFVSTSHGLFLRGWFAGLGTGIDYYRMRTVPVFAEVRKELSDKNIRPLIQITAGLNIDWLTQAQRNHRFSWWQTTPSTFRNGMYLKAGGGVLFNAHKQIRFATTISWSYKSIIEKYSDRLWDPWTQPVNDLTERTLLYKLQRVEFGVKVIF